MAGGSNDHWKRAIGRIVWYGPATVAGVTIGFVALFVYANSEDWVYYSARSFVTGRTAMSEIVDHPADFWVCLAIPAVFLTVGGVVGVAIASHVTPYRPPAKTDDTTV